MNYNKKTIMDVDVAGKKILLRCDFNVPQDKETHAITSDKRIVASLPTIRYLLERGAAPEKLRLLNVGETPPAQGSVTQLYRALGLDADGVSAAVREVLA